VTTVTGPITELSSRRLGPVRRYFVRRPAAMDAVVIAFFVAAVVASAVDPAQAQSLPAAPIVAVIGAGALVFRRSRPVVVAGALSVLAVGTVAITGQLGGVELGIAFALYAVAVTRPIRIAWLTAAATTIAATVAVWLWEGRTPDPVATSETGTLVLTDDRWASTAGLLIMAFAAMSIGISVRRRREHDAAMVERAEALARDRDRQAQLARAAERSRIAREMHDVVAHSISVMITLSDGASASLDRAPERSRAALAELSAAGRAALGDMRRVLGALADDGAPMEPTGDLEALTTLVDRFRAAGLPVRAEGLGLPVPDDAGLRLAIYRVVQEALTNVLRHAPGTPRVDVTVCADPGRWVVDVTDHGATQEADDAGGSGMGLIGMRERAQMLGGTVEAGPSEHGWRVHAELPAQEVHR
jgi:signal transduction histidine kinase